MFTTEEVSQYARLTLKEHGLHDYEIVWLPRLKRTLGMANPWQKRIELSPKVLQNFKLFKYILLHEICHIHQFHRMGGTYKVNGRNDFHGKVFKEVCAEVGIPYRLKYVA